MIAAAKVSMFVKTVAMSVTTIAALLSAVVVSVTPVAASVSAVVVSVATVAVSVTTVATSLSAVVVFVCGAFYEASCVGFVHFSEGGSAWKTATMSMLAGVANVTGIFGSVHDWHVGPFFVLGLGVGAFVGVRLKQRRSPRDRYKKGKR